MKWKLLAIIKFNPNYVSCRLLLRPASTQLHLGLAYSKNTVLYSIGMQYVCQIVVAVREELINFQDHHVCMDKRRKQQN